MNIEEFKKEMKTALHSLKKKNADYEAKSNRLISSFLQQMAKARKNKVDYYLNTTDELWFNCFEFNEDIGKYDANTGTLIFTVHHHLQSPVENTDFEVVLHRKLCETLDELNKIDGVIYTQPYSTYQLSFREIITLDVGNLKHD